MSPRFLASTAYCAVGMAAVLGLTWDSRWTLLSDSQAAAISGGHCYRENESTICASVSGLVDPVQCHSSCVADPPDTDNMRCIRPDNPIPLPDPLSNAGIPEQYQVENNQYDSVSPAPPGVDTYESTIIGPESVPCQVVYKCICSQMYGACHPNDTAWGGSSAASYPERLDRDSEECEAPEDPEDPEE